MKNEQGYVDSDLLGALIGAVFIIICIVAWFTHVFTCLAEGAWGFLIAGALMFPVAIIHGVGVWFGFF